MRKRDRREGERRGRLQCVQKLNIYRRSSALVSFFNNAFKTFPCCLRIPLIGAQLNDFQALVIL
ncbi:hypothetical protein RchiOBHm_Chr5g0077821 [Rosa chinensis]|uniref:Uncharacterized protein n=1 Tax=Rosa chinensis TaxID=74649 RepID=A0A2P6QM38_ROSCH|nr:hypothetical protein RchiOBHm_Chr5g0077821 [Rosa chinensis]